MEQEFWYSGQKRPGVAHKVAHTACCLNTCSLPLLSLEIHPPANSDIKPGFVRKMLVVQPQNRPGQKRPGVTHKMAHTALLLKKNSC